MRDMIITLVIASAGGKIFSMAGLPIPWMLGSLAGILLWRGISGAKAVLPQKLKNSSLVILGLVMGKSFSQEAATRIMDQFLIIILATILTVLFSIAMAHIINKLCGIGLSSAILGSIPGGLSQMVILSEEVEEAQPSLVTLMQTIRLLLVVLIVPFIVQKGLAHQTVAAAGAGSIMMPGTGSSWAYLLFSIGLAAMGALLALRIKLPTPYLIGPILILAALVLAGFPAPQVPSLLVIAAQVITGAYMAVRFNVQQGTNIKQLLFLTVITNVTMVLFTFGVGYLIALRQGQRLLTAFLSMSPGGISEMGITAVAVGADLAVVTSYQLFRVLFILLVVAPLLRRFLRGIPASPEGKRCEHESV